MRRFVPDPERQHLGSETQSVGGGVGATGEMLEADEDRAAAAQDELAGVGGAEPDHQVAVGGAIGLNQVVGARERLAHHPGNVHRREQHLEVGAVGRHRVMDHLGGGGAVEVENVVVPVGGEDGAMPLEIVSVGGFGIGGGEEVEKFRGEIDKHAH